MTGGAEQKQPYRDPLKLGTLPPISINVMKKKSSSGGNGTEGEDDFVFAGFAKRFPSVDRLGRP